MSAQTSIRFSEVTPLTVSEHYEWSDLEVLRAPWSNLVSQNSSLNVFQTYEWLFSWWTAYHGDNRICVLVFRDGQAGVVGIIPVYWERRKSPLFYGLQVLRMVGDGSGDSDDLDFIVKPGFAPSVIRAFLSWLSYARWDLCELDCLSSNSEAVALLREGLQSLHWTVLSSDRPLARVDFPQTWQEYLKQISAKERRKIGTRTRRLESRYQVRFRRCDHPDDLSTFLSSLYSLHQKRWEQRGQPGSFSFAPRRTFYHEMTRRMLQNGWLDLWLLELDGIPVAAQIGMRYRNRNYALQEGFDPAYASDSVGYVLRSQILRACIEAGILSYDFLYGDQDSKQRWGAQLGKYLDIHFTRPRTKGAFYLAFGQALRSSKDWIRAHTPSGMWESLQMFRQKLQKKSLEDDESSPLE